MDMASFAISCRTKLRVLGVTQTELTVVGVPVALESRFLRPVLAVLEAVPAATDSDMKTRVRGEWVGEEHKKKGSAFLTVVNLVSQFST